MQTVPYLNFDGNCAEAFRFYEKCLGGKAQIQTHGDTPMAGEVAPEWRDRVMHAHLEADGAILMGSDAPLGRGGKPQGIHVSLHVDDPAEADRIFAALSEGGEVTMPLAETFWAKRFGMFVDRFGIPWMINSASA